MAKDATYDLICVGGGAAGFFTAIRYAELNNGARILILEKSKRVLSKVRISGGGRCNVTHACFDPREMITHYPRGEKELRGPFHHFLCGDMMAWLSDHGVETKIEEDGRVFPVSDSSETIIDLFEACCATCEIEVKTSQAVIELSQKSTHWEVSTTDASYASDQVMLATGSTPSVWKMMEKMGYEIVSPVPSLFTFNIKHPLLSELQGLSMPNATVSVIDSATSQTLLQDSGPLLITHWGLSGPAILKLSSRGARWMASQNHHFAIKVDWLSMDPQEVVNQLSEKRETDGKQTVSKHPLFGMPKRLWKQCCEVARVGLTTHAEMSKQQVKALSEQLSSSVFNVHGKSTYKEEFVTCGGVERKQLDFKTMQSRLHPGLFLAGEVIDIDAVTGGFNFQAAWTEGWLAARAMLAPSK